MVGALIGRKDSLGFRHDGTIWFVLAYREGESLTDAAPVSSSDATNIRTSIKQEGNEIVINGRKWCVSQSDLPLALGGSHRVLQVD